MLKQKIEKELGKEITDILFKTIMICYTCKANTKIMQNKKSYWKDLIVLADRLSSRNSKIHYVNYKIIELESKGVNMDKDKLYYLSHPYSTHGNKIENVVKSKIYANSLRSQGYKVINPIAIINESDDDIAMAKCRQLYDVCDAIIFCPGHTLSVGCKEERDWAYSDEKEIYYLTNMSLEITPHIISRNDT